MAVETHWAHFFKHEVRKQGFDLFAEGVVFLQIAADTQIQALFKGTAHAKVHLKSSSIASPSFNADCSCPSSGKGHFCKHIWATLLAVEKKHPDFLDSKIEIHKVSELTVSKTLKPRAASQDHAAAAAAKQSDYRKEQYQKQKQKLKDRKKSQRDQEKVSPLTDFPEEIQKAIQFFSENGFTFTHPPGSAELMNARKILSRIFHPDKGGTHEEALLLNENYEVLMDWATR